MLRALKLARGGMGRTDPNPMVGAVLVKDGKIVGQGYHRAAGQPHAEAEAIRDAGNDARGATLFVTLEPCNHHGRTPPCTQAIIEAGVKEVYYGMEDPNPDVAGGGAETLQRDAGIRVVGHVLEDRCRALNEVYLTHITRRRPFVFLKLAMSLDGRIATRTGRSRWITSEASRKRVHQLRDRVSAVMTGVGTVLADDPSLTTRLPGKRGKDPLRVIVDSRLRTPLHAKVLNSSPTAGVIIAARKEPPADRRKQLEGRGARVLTTNDPERVDLRGLLYDLYGMNVTSVLLEGGAGLAWGALAAGVVDRCFFFYAPIIIGGEAAPAGVGGLGVDSLTEVPRLDEMTVSRVGPDLLVSGRAVYPDTAAMEAGTAENRSGLQSPISKERADRHDFTD